MGYDLGKAIADADMSIEDRLSWQLVANHTPSVSEDFIPVAKEAIFLACNENWDTVLEYPNGIRRTVAWTIAKLHLEPFVPTMDIPEDEEEETNA